MKRLRLLSWSVGLSVGRYVLVVVLVLTANRETQKRGAEHQQHLTEERRSKEMEKTSSGGSKKKPYNLTCGVLFLPNQRVGQTFLIQPRRRSTYLPGEKRPSKWSKWSK